MALGHRSAGPVFSADGTWPGLAFPVSLMGSILSTGDDGVDSSGARVMVITDSALGMSSKRLHFGHLRVRPLAASGAFSFASQPVQVIAMGMMTPLGIL